jgi:thiamine-monophosphate kinase
MTAGPAGVEPRLGEIGERRIFDEVLRPHYRDVPFYGDDCARFGRDRVVTTDACSRAMVDSLGTPDWFHTGWLLATMNLSDLAAAGAEPEGLVVAYTLPPDTPVSMLHRLIDGVDACARHHGTVVRGGDMRDGPAVHLSATAFGRCPLRLTRHGVVPGRMSRRGARPGDRLVLVGSPGWLWAAAVLRTTDVTVPPDVADRVLERARRPQAQLVAGRLLARRGLATAAIDVSDGLHASVRLLCDASGTGARLHPRIALDEDVDAVAERAGIDGFRLGQMWGDWCLLVAVPPTRADRVVELLHRQDIGAREIGLLTTGHALHVDGTATPWDGDGLDQERFSERSWTGDGIGHVVARLRELSGSPGARR